MRKLLLLIGIFLIPGLFITQAENPSKADVDVVVTIHTDSYGEEIGWTLKSSDGSVTYGSVDFESYGDNTTYTENVSVPEGTDVVFTIMDSYGDGLGSSGWYNVKAYDFQFAQGSGNFGSEQEHSFTVTPPPTNNARMEKIEVAEFLEKGIIDISGVLSNWGAENLTNVKVSWSVNGGSVNEDHITGLSLSSNETYSFTHSIQWDASTGNIDAYNNLEVWVSEPNGVSDENSTDDKIAKEIYLLNETAPRKVLIEHFTNASCGPCSQQNPILDELLHQGDNLNHVAHIAYHTSWPGTDPMYDFNSDNGQGDARVSYYSVGGVPNAVVAGNQFQGSPASIKQSHIDSELKRVSLFRTDVSTSLDGSILKLDVDLTSLTDFSNITSDELFLHVALVEDVHYESAPGSNGEKDFPDAMRFMLTGTSGINIGLPAGQELNEYSFSQDLGSDINLDSTQALIFVQNASSKEIYSVYQKDLLTPPKITFNPPNGAENIAEDAKIRINFNHPARMTDDSPINNPGDFIALKKDNENGTDVNFTASINITNTIITVVPENDLEFDTQYHLKVDTSFENFENDTFPGNSTSFTVLTPQSPKVSFVPGNNEIDVRLDPSFVIEFDQAIRLRNDSALNEPGQVVLLTKNSIDGESVEIDATINESKNQIVVKPVNILEIGTNYFLEISDTLENKYNLPLDPQSIKVTTYDQNTSITLIPDDGATEVELDTTITIQFESVLRNIDDSEVDSYEPFLNLSIGADDSENVDFITDFDSTSLNLLVIPTNSLKPGTTYYFNVMSGLENEYDVPLHDTTISFKTIEEEDVVGVGREYEQTDVKVFPNPASNIVNIDIPENVIVVGISLMTLDGKIEKTFEIKNTDRLNLEFGDLVEGFYLLKIKLKNSTITKKILIAR